MSAVGIPRLKAGEDVKADAEIRLQLIEYQKRVFGTCEVERKLALSSTIIPSAPPADNLEDALRSYTLSAAPTTAVDSQEQGSI